MEPEEYASIYSLEESHWWYVGMQRTVTALLDTYLQHRAGIDVLDAGCGTGGMMMALGRYGLVTGIDASDIAIQYCRKRGLGRAFLGSVVDLPFCDERFDLVTSFDVLYHINVVDDVEALKEFRRVLRPGGTLCLRLPAFDWLRSSHDEMVHTRHRYTVDEVQEKAEWAGFRPLKVTYANSLLFPAALGARIWQRLSGGSDHAESDVRPASPLVNRMLLSVLGLESRILQSTNLPVGLSVICIARKP